MVIWIGRVFELALPSPPYPPGVGWKVLGCLDMGRRSLLMEYCLLFQSSRNAAVLDPISRASNQSPLASLYFSWILLSLDSESSEIKRKSGGKARRSIMQGGKLYLSTWDENGDWTLVGIWSAGEEPGDGS